jgi:hypothetical protein
MRILAGIVVAVMAGGCHRASAPAGAAAAQAEAKRGPAGGGGRADSNDHDGRPQAAPQSDLEVVVNGKLAPAWTLERMAIAKKMAVTNPNGEARDGWPLRDLTRALVGTGARVVALASDDERVSIAPSDWQSRTILLRLSHRGEYKAQFVDGQGDGDDAFLKHIRRIEIVN